MKKYRSLQSKVEEVLKTTHTNILFVREDATVLIQKDQESNVDQYKVPNATADKIKKEIRDSSYEGQIQAFLASKNYTAKAFQGRGFSLLLSAIFESSDEDLEKFVEFIEFNNNLKLADHFADNVATLARSKGLPDAVINNLSGLNELRDAGGNSIGPGEILFAIVFSDITNSTTGGDLQYGNKKIEVKKNEGHFGQQAGRGGMKPLKTIFVKSFIRNPDKLKEIDKTLSIRLGDILLASYKAVDSKQEFVDEVIKTLNSIYANNAPLAEKYFNEELFRSGDIKRINNALLKLNTDGYLKNDFVMFIDKKYNYVVSTKEDLIKTGGHIDTGKVRTLSNFTINDLYPKIGIK
jgi:hypothetical protein